MPNLAARIDLLTPVSTPRHFCICLEPAVADIGNLRGGGGISLAFVFVVELFAARSSRSLHFAERNLREKQQECDGGM